MKRLYRFVLLALVYPFAVARVLGRRVFKRRNLVFGFAVAALVGMATILTPAAPASAAPPTAGLNCKFWHNSNNTDTTQYFGETTSSATWGDGDNVTKFDASTPTGDCSTWATDIGTEWSLSQYYNINNTERGSKVQDVATLDNYTVMFRGYLKPSITSSNLFLRVVSDDASYLWAGANAVSGWSRTNATAKHPGLHGTGNGVSSPGSISVASGKYYPIRLLFGEMGGGDVVTLTYNTDNGLTWNAVPSSWLYNQGTTATNDQTVPTAPGAPALTAATDSGASTSDGITSNTAPVLAGTAEGSSTVSVYSNPSNSNSGGTLVGTATASAAGAFTYTLSLSSSTDVFYYVTATDGMGYQSDPSPTTRIRANNISITTAAAGARSGAALAVQPVVTLTDGGTALITASNNLGVVSNGTAAAVSGIATFSGTSIAYTSGTLAGSTMTFAATGYFPATSTLSAIPSTLTVATGTSTAGGTWINDTYYATTASAVTLTPTDLATRINGATATTNLLAFGDITVSNAVSSTTSGNGLKLATNASININAKITTANGSVTGLANADNLTGASAGQIVLPTTGGVETTGGAIIFAGGDWSSSVGYARGFATATGTLNSGFYSQGDLASGGGSITIRGASGTATIDSAATYLSADASISAAGGNIALEGVIGSDQTQTTSPVRAVRFGGGSTSPYVSVTTSGAGTISITGDNTSSAYANRGAILLEFATITSGSGAINLTAKTATNNSAGLQFVTGQSSITSTSGAITLEDTAATAIASDLSFLTASTAGTLSLRFNNPTFATTTNLSGTGALLVVPVSANFTSATFSFPGVASTIGTTFSQLDVGRVATTSHITLSGSNLSVAGQVNIYGTNILQTARLTTSGASANTINYFPAGTFSNTAATGTIDSAGGLSVAATSVTINAPVAAKGDIWLEATGAALDVTVKGNIITSVAGSNLTLKSKNHILVPDVATIQTAGANTGVGGNLIFWSDSDATGEGAIDVESDSIFNSIGGSPSATTGGGHIVMAGGADTGASTVKTGRVSGDKIPDGYALTTSTSRAGVELRTDGLAASVLKINSGGGKIEMFGKSIAGIEGVYFVGPIQVNSGEGQVVIDGTTNAYHGIQIANAATPTAINLITSSSATSPAIDIRGVYTGGGSGYNYGILSGYGESTLGQVIQATGAGGINLYGRSNGGHRDIGINGTAVLSTSGKITVDAGGTTGIITNKIQNNSGLGAQYNYFGRCPVADCPGSLVTTSAANIEMITNSITTFVVTDVLTRIYTSGEVDIHNPTGTTAFLDIGAKFSGLDFASSITKLTIGRSGDTTAMDIDRDWSIDGPISVYGSDLDLKSNIVSTRVNSPIRIESTTIIVLYNGKKIQTAGGSAAEIILWSNKAGAGGSLYSESSVCINTVGTCTPTTAQIKSGGASVYIAGGNNTGSYPTGYAVKDGRNSVGIRLGLNGNTGFKIYTGGGDLTMRGKGDYGIYTPGGETINVGDGQIIMDGYAESQGQGIRISDSATAATTTYTSSKDGGTAISMTGTCTGTIDYTAGIMFFQSAVTNNVEATGTGAISMVGRTPNSTAMRGLWFNSVNVYATSGNIVLDAGASRFAINQTYVGALNVGSRSTGTSATGNVTIYADNIENYNAPFNIRTTGDVVAEPVSATWTYADVVWRGVLDGVDDLRIGKDNGANAQGQSLWIYAEQVAAGNMEFYGNNVSFQWGGAKTTGSGKYLSAIATGYVQTFANMTLQTNGGQLAVWADKDNNGTGYVKLENGSCVNTQNSCVTPAESGGGNLYIGGGASSLTTPAYPVGATNTQSDNYAIWLGTSAASANNIKIYSGGGNISIKAHNAALNQYLIRSFDGLQINSGPGQIDIIGTSSGSGSGTTYGLWVESPRSESAIKSSKASGTAINIDITTPNTGDWATPILFWYGSDAVRNVIAATGGGNIVMKGTAAGTGANTYSFDLNNADIFTKGTGTIEMTGNRGFWFNRYTAGKVNIGASATDTMSGNITLSGGRLVSYSTLPVNFKTTGDVTLQPMAATSSFLEDVTYPSGSSVFTGVNNLTVGKDGNTKNVTLNAVTGTKTLKVYGQDLTLGGDVSVSMATKTSDGFMAKALGAIEQSANVDITTSGGRATLWARSGVADSATTTYGKIWLKDAATITTNGGDIRLAGSSNVTDGYPTGHALSNTANSAGVRLGETNTLVATVKLLSAGATGTAGGDIIINGQSTATSQWGVNAYGGVQVNSGLGRISIDGVAAGTDDGVEFMNSAAAPTFTSAAVDSQVPAIKISGTSSGDKSGMQLSNAGSTISATGTGDVEINGVATGTGSGLDISGAKILASTGSITINGGTKGTKFNQNGTTVNDIGDTAATPTSTSDINIIGDVFVTSTTYLTKLATKGNVVLESSGAKFTTFTLSGFSVNALASSIRVGKTNDTESAISIAGALSANGPISVYGGVITVSAALTSSKATDTQGILLKAGVDVLLSANLTTSGGPITLWADSDNANQGGILVGSAATLSSSGGAVSLGGGNGATVLDGYAKATTSISSVSNPGLSGIRFLGDITSGDGDIALRGSDTPNNSTLTGHFSGIEIERTTSIVTVGGDVTLDGYVPAAAQSASGNHIGVLLAWGGTSTAKGSISTTSGNIRLIGSSADRNISNSYGLWLQDANLSSDAGNIVTEGYAGALASASVYSTGSTVTSTTGAVSVTSDSNGAPATFASTTMSSDTSVTLSVYSPSMSGLALNGSGHKVLESPSGTDSFKGPISNAFTLASTSKSLRIGKASNTTDVTLSSAISIAGPITIYGGALSTTAAVTSTGDSITYSGASFTNSAALTTTNKDITISADAATINAALTTTSTTSGVVTIAPKTVGKNIDLGAANSASLLALDATELARITANTLRIGSMTHANNINVSAAVTLGSAKVPTLALRGAGDVTQSGTGTIAVANLGINVTGTITLGGGGHSISGNLALNGSGVTFSQTSMNYTPNTVDTIAASFGTGDVLSVTAIPAVNSASTDQFMAVAFNPPPVATVKDKYSNSLELRNTLNDDYKVTVSKTSGSGTLEGTTSINAVLGAATFSNLKITGSTGDHVLAFTLAPVIGTATFGTATIASGTYNVQAGDPNNLNVLTPASGGTSDAAFTTQPVIQIRDVANNLVALDPGKSAVVTATISAGGTRVGSATATAVNSVATFSGLGIKGLVSGSYTITYSIVFNSTTISKDQTGITIGSGVATTLDVVQPASASNAIVFATQPVVTAKDSAGNVATTQAGTVTVANGSLTGTKTKALISGVANFAGQDLKLTGTIGSYPLTYTMGSLTTISSVTLNHGVATKLALTTSAAGFVNRQVFDTAPVITVLDVSNNPVLDSVASVTIESTNAPISGTFTMNAVNGIANFANKSLKLTGTAGPQTLTYKATDLTSIPQSFELLHGAAYELRLVTEGAGAKAGVKFTTSPRVEILDQDANLVNTGDSAGASITASISGTAYNSVAQTGVNLLGTTSLDAVAGVATFDNLRLEGVAATYALTFAATAPAAVSAFADSQTIGLLAGAATKLRPVAQPTDIVAGVAFGTTVTVEILDAFNNRVLVAANAITPTLIDTASTPNTIATKIAVTAVNGLATFTGLTFTKAGAHKIVFSATDLTSTASNTFEITNAAPHHLTWITQPIGAKNGVALSPAPVLEVRDEFENPALVGAATAVAATIQPANSDVISVSGASASSNSSARVTFASLILKAKAGNYGLRFTAANGTLPINGKYVDTTSTVAIAQGDPENLNVLTPAAGGTSDAAFATQPVIQVRDSAGNLVSGEPGKSAVVTATISAGGTRVGAATATAINSIATFSGLGIKGLVSSSYTITYSIVFNSTTISKDQTGITIGSGVATALEVVQPASASNAIVFDTQPVVTAKDSAGNVATTQAGTVTVANGSLTGTKTKALVNGVANFAGQDLKLTGTIGSYPLTYTMGSLTTISSLQLNHGVATKLELITEAAGFVNRENFSTQPVIAVQDESGNRVLDSAVAVEVSISSATLTGVTTVNALNGLASFVELGKFGAVGDKTLTFKSTGLTDDTQTFLLTHGAATKLELTTAASSARAGIAFGGQPVVRVLDADDNLVNTGENASATIQVSTSAEAYNAASHTGADLLGTLSVAAVEGVATFAGLHIDGVAATYSLSYSATAPAGITGFTAVTQSLAVAAGTQTALRVVAQPADIVAGETFGTTVTVEVLDAFNNRVLVAANAITPTLIDTASTPNTIATKTAVAASNGLTTFTGLTFTKAGAHKIVFTATDLTSTTSNTFEITNAAPHHLTWVTEPTGAKNGVALSPAPVLEVRDAFENPALVGAATTVAASIQPANTDVISVSGASATSNASARVTFANLVLQAKAGNYGLRFTAANGTLPINGTFVDTTSTVAIAQGDPENLNVLTSAAGGTSDAAFATQPVIQVRDSAGNLVSGEPGKSAVVTATISAGGTRVGAATATAINSVATFSGLGIKGLVSDSYTITYSIDFAGTAIVVDQTGITIGSGVATVLEVAQPAEVSNDAVFATQPVVTAKDSAGNVATTQVGSVAVANGSLTGTKAKALVNGVANFAGQDLKLTGTIGSYPLTYTMGSLTTISSVTLKHGVATKLSLTTPADGFKNREVFTTAPVITVLDVSSNQVLDSAVEITVESTNAALSGTATVPAANGRANFANKNLKLTGTVGDQMLTYKATDLTSASQSFTLLHGAATKLELTTAASSAKAGIAFGGQPVVHVLDADNNLVNTGENASATIAVSTSAASYNAANHTGADLLGTLSAQASAGVATFSGLHIDGVAATYSLSFSATAPAGITGFTAVTQALEVAAGTQTALRVVGQPADIVAGVAFGTTVTVEILDAFNNRVLDATNQVTPTLFDTALVPATIDATKAAVAPTSGLVSFSGLTFTKAGTHKVRFAATDLSATTSNVFKITNAAPHHLTWIAEPTGAKNDVALSPAPVLEVRDAFENPAISGTATTVTATIQPASSGVLRVSGSSATSSSFDAQVTFDNLVLRAKIGNYGLRFTAANGSLPIDGTSIDTTSTVAITHGDPTQLAITTDAAGARSGYAFGTQPVVEIRDSAGNRVADSALTISASMTNRDIIGASTAQAINGIATFANLGLNGAAANSLQLNFKTAFNDVEIATSQPINLAAGAAVEVVIGQQPATVKTRDAFALAPTATVLDLWKNPVLSDNETQITAQLIDSTGAAVGAKSNAVTVVGGTATFSALAFTATPAAGYRIEFAISPAGDTITSNSFTINPGTATKLVITRQPATLELDGSKTKTGELLATQPIVKLYDQDDNLVTTANSGSATIAVKTGLGADLSEGTTTANFVGGIANFAGVKLVGTPSADYTLEFSSTSPNPALTSAASTAISVKHNDAHRLVLTRDSANGRAGTRFDTQPQITIQDRYSNTVTTGAGSRLLVRTSAESTAPVVGAAVVSGESQLQAVAGVANFSYLGLAGSTANTYKLTFSISSSSVVSASQADIRISYGFSDRVVMVTQPIGGNATGDALTTQPVVAVQDAYGNLVADANDTVTASIVSTSGLTLADGSIARLTGQTMDAQDGTATFTALKLFGLPTTNYRLQFTIGQNPATATDIQVTHAVAHHATIVAQPVGGNATGANLAGQPVVELRDQFQNIVTSNSTDVLTAHLASSMGVNRAGGPADPERLAGSTTATFSAGVATFAGLKVIALPETLYTLNFDATVGVAPIASATSSTFGVTYSTATKLAIHQQPVANVTGELLTTQPIIEVQDIYGNRVRNYVGTVAVTLPQANSTLSNSTYAGSASRFEAIIADGRATFSGLEITAVPGTDYQLNFASSPLTSINSGNLQVVAAAPFELRMVSQPTGAQTNEELSGQPVVRVVDKFGNTVLSDDSTVITASIIDGAGGVLSRVSGGTAQPLTTTVVAGVGTFDHLIFRGVSLRNYKLAFASTTLVTATSNDFFVTHADASKLIITTQPVSGATGLALTTQPVLELRDFDENIAISDDTTVVTASITSGDGSGTLTNATATARDGIVRFSNLTLTGTPGQAYQITFTGDLGVLGSVTSVPSGNVTPLHGAPNQLAMRGTAVVGGLVGEDLVAQPKLNVLDSFGNLATTDNLTVVTANILANSTGQVLGTTTATAVNGLVDFSGLKATGTPGTAYTLRFSATSSGATLATADSNTFTLSKQAAVTLSYAARAYAPDALVLPVFTTDSPGVVTYSTNTEVEICTLNTATGAIIIKGAGTCSVRVSVAATEFYLANAIDADLEIAKARQAAITITSANSVNYWGTVYPAATGGSGNGALSFAVNGTCRLVANTVIPGDAGSRCRLTATVLGDENYLPEASLTQTINVLKIDQAPLMMASSGSLKVGTLNLLAAGGSGTGALSYSVVSNSTNTANCSIVGTVLTSTINGTCSVKAVKAASTNYNFVETLPQQITVSKQEQSVAFTSTVPMYPVALGSYTPVASASSALAVGFSLVTDVQSPACAFDPLIPAKILFLTAGECKVVATQAGNDVFSSASASQVIQVGILNQSIVFAAITDKGFGTPGFMISATSNSGLPVALATTSGSTACTLASNGLVALVRAGLCEISATQAGNLTYGPASAVVRSFNVAADLAGAPQIISVSSASQAFTASFTAPSYTGGSAILGYKLMLTDVNGGVYTNSACATVGTPLTCTVVGLPNGIAYTAKVAAVTVAGIGSFSASSIPQTPVEAPLAVTNLAATPVAGNLVVNWDVPTVSDDVFIYSEFVSYKVYVAPIGSDFPALPSAIIEDPRAKTATIVLSNSTPVEVASVRSASFGRASFSRAAVSTPTPTPVSSSLAGYNIRVVTVTTSASVSINDNTSNGVQIGFAVPFAPAQMILSPQNTSLWISWSAPTADGGQRVLNYDVKVNGVLACEGTTAFECTYVGMTAGTTYNVEVFARSSVGLSPAAVDAYSVPAPPAPPAAPSTPTPEATPSPTASPTPTAKPTVRPTPKPTAKPTAKPSSSPSPSASAKPTEEPTEAPIAKPEEPTDPGAQEPSGPQGNGGDTMPFEPGAPVANPAIGATGDDDAPSVPFDPLATEEGIKALAKTTAGAAAIAAAVAAAAAAAAAGGARTAGGAGGSSAPSGDAGSIANIDAAHENYRLRRRGRGDRWKLWKSKFMTFLDKPSVALTVASGKFSPLLTRIFEDGAYLRAAFGSFAILPTIAALAISVISLIANGETLQPPIWQLFLAIAVIGIFDTFAGALGTAVFVIGSLAIHGFSDLDDLRMLLGVIIVGYGPALLANAFRAFRKVPEAGTSYWWERLVDLGVLPFIGGWTTSAMISTLPALAGVTLSVANHVGDFSLAIALAIMIRVIAEEASARIFPQRLDYLHPTDVADAHKSQRWISLVLRLAIFIFVTAALMGNDWRVLLGSVLFVLPNLIGFYAERFKNFPWLWRILPNGIPGLALTLVIATATTNLVGSWFGASPELVLWSFVLLPIPMLALSLLHMFGREGNEGEERWIMTPKATWIYRIGGIGMLVATMMLAGVI